MRHVLATTLLLLLTAGTASATVYTVKKDGMGSYAVIQDCMNVAVAGDTCQVYAGTYAEHVNTVRGGTSESARITLSTSGVVTVLGFRILHAYITVNGFDITGYTNTATGSVVVYGNGHYFTFTNNTIRDGVYKVYGFRIYPVSTGSATHAIVRGNTITNLLWMSLDINGSDHLFEQNSFTRQNGMDFGRIFGSDMILRRNIFSQGEPIPGLSNHPDFVQTFGGSGRVSENVLWEENWIQGLESQLSQLNSGDADKENATNTDTIKNWTFRRNVIISVSMNMNVIMPGVTLENNTFYKMAYLATGIISASGIVRGESSRLTMKNNVFLEGGSTPSAVNDMRGFYMTTGGTLSEEAINWTVTFEPTDGLYGPIADAILVSLAAQGYVNPNGLLLAKGRAVTAASQLVLLPEHEVYRDLLFAALVRVQDVDALARATWYANYNYVAGAAASNYPAKRVTGCPTKDPWGEYSFCETNGINGGNPSLTSLANMLGPDALPFTIDDGLKPLPGSILCGKGENGADIGAYSCQPGVVFAGVPAVPTNVRIR